MLKKIYWNVFREVVILIFYKIHVLHKIVVIRWSIPQKVFSVLGFFVLIDSVRTVSGFLPCISHGKDQNESRLEQNKIRKLFVVFWQIFFCHWKIGGRKKELGFTSFSSPASKAHKVGKNPLDWQSGIKGDIKGWYNKCVLYNILGRLHNIKIINLWEIFLDFCSRLHISCSIYCNRQKV